ncbi:MAG: histidinol-phosphatase HisJ family protein [Mariprofundaceae bacterium]|nr:histidinol-phosphatase HisJ family protein [Mariprofundaceae bacterium]
MKYHPVPDYHMHTPRCNHAVGTVAEYAGAALLLGLKEIGISDHSPMPDGFDEWRMRRSELDGYLDEVYEVKKAYADRLRIKAGLEADFHPETEDYVKELLSFHDWDYVIGSVHYIGPLDDRWGFDNPDELDRWDAQDVEAAYVAYFGLVADSARSGIFDIIGHPDLIKKFGHRPPLDSRKVHDAEEAMLDAVKAADIALEISSAGLRKPVAEVYPHARIIARAAELGVPVSFGSDAHAPGEVGHAMDACLSMLEMCGVTEIATFSGRVRQMQPIQRLSGV